MSDPKPVLDVAYFSMEVMLETDIPTYAGGLGVLAGDLLRSCADLKVPAVGISLVYSGKFMKQIVHPDGSQEFEERDWQKSDQLQQLPDQVKIIIDNTEVTVGCWRYDIVGLDEFVVPVYLLDLDLMENPQWIREITQNLYDVSKDYYRISQEIVLGIGGVKMLRQLGYHDIKTYHINEGHGSLATLELLAENNYSDDAVRKLCVFTTHTPMPEGHDKFGYDFVFKYAGKYLPWHIRNLAGNDCLNMTLLGMNLSHASLAVSAKHQKVSEHLFPGYHFGYVTNGVHHRTWVGSYVQDLFEHYIPGWLQDPSLLKNAVEKLPDDALWLVHKESKNELITYVNKHMPNVLPYVGYEMKPWDYFDTHTLTISLARRPVAYKRPLLIYKDIERLARIGAGKIQIIQCGRSHPHDPISQDFIHQIIEISNRLKGVMKIAFLENYSPKITRQLVAGTDVWLNTPRRPLEASGTSGMKAAANGVLNFSVLDGWWIEGYAADPLAGFAIGPSDDRVEPDNDDNADAVDLYNLLETEVVPLYYDRRPEWIKRMKHAISLAGFFNTHRCLSEYQQKAWNK
jgi:starch phosphorylase